MKWFAFVLLFAWTCSTSALMAQTKIDGSFTFQTVTKKYSILVPNSYQASKPNKMMVGMHPLNTSRWDSKSWRDTLTVFANTNNLLLVCPDGGTNGNILDQIDTAFTTALIDSMYHWYNVDSNQVYIMGFSWGGKATYVYGLERPDLFDGYMPIGAATSISDLTQKRKDNAYCKPVAVIHGANDAASTRYTPMVDSLKNYTDFLWDTLLTGVGHTIDFANRNAILTMGFHYIDSINNLPLQVNLGADASQCGSDSVSLGSNLDVSGGSCEYTYTWSPNTGLSNSNVPNPKARVSSVMTYVLEVTDTEGNTDRDTLVVTPRSLPTVMAGVDDTLCPGAGKLFVAQGAQSYLWSPATGLSCTQCDSTVITTSSSQMYVVEGTDTFGCMASDTLSIEVFAKPTIQTSNDTSLCVGDTGQFQTTGGVSYRWRSSLNLSDSTLSNPSYFPTATSVFVVDGTDSNGCVASDFVVVNVRSLPTVSTLADTLICYKENLSLTASGGTNYQWSGSSGLSCQSCDSTTFIGLSTAQIVVEGSNSFGCIGRDTLMVQVRAPIPIQLTPDTSICQGESVVLQVAGGNTYQWSPSGSLSCSNCSNPQSTATTTTVYQVVVTDTALCQDTDEVEVAVMPLPTTTFNGDTLICEGDTGTLLLSSTGTIRWLSSSELDDSTSLAPNVWPAQSRWYRLESTGINQCSTIDSVFVEVQNPMASFTVSGTGNVRSFDKSASQNYDSFQYLYGTAPGVPGNESFEFTQNGTFTICLEVFTNEGCLDSACQQVTITSVGISSIHSERDHIRIFPNPSQVEFSLMGTDTQELVINLWTLQGQLIEQWDGQGPHNIQHLAPGQYVVEINQASTQTYHRLIKE